MVLAWPLAPVFIGRRDFEELELKAADACTGCMKTVSGHIFGYELYNNAAANQYITLDQAYHDRKTI